MKVIKNKTLKIIIAKKNVYLVCKLKKLFE